MTRRELLAGVYLSAQTFPGQTVPRQPDPKAPTIFSGATVITGAGDVLPDQVVVIEQDRIVTVAPASNEPLPAGARVIDARGKFMIPGLWDAHAHLSYFKASALPLLLANGVTAVRDMGGLLGEIDVWKTETDQELRPGPRIFRVGPILNGKAFNEFQIVVSDAAEARGAVRVLRNANVDIVKVHAAISREAYFGVQSACRQVGLRYVGHMPRAIKPEEASDSGQLTLEHVGAFADRFASEGIAPNDVAQSLERFRKTDAPALFARFARNRTWFTPTLIASQRAIHLGDHAPDPRDKYVSVSCKKITADLLKRPSYQAFFSPESVNQQKREFDELQPLVKLMHQSGVGLLAGTDFAVSIIYPGFSLHDELELLVESGLTPMESLLTATANPAHVLGQPNLGTIKTGNLADLVLLQANPLNDIRNTRKIWAVMSRGKLFDSAALAQLLADAETEAKMT